MHKSQYERPICSIDAVLLRIFEDQLQVALIKRPADARVYANTLALPGGFVFTDQDKTLLDSLNRNLQHKVGFTPDYVSKLEFDGNASRDPQGWSITCPFLGIVADGKGNSTMLTWENITTFIGGNKAEPLPFDHAKLINSGFFHLYNRAKYSTEPNAFLKAPFTLSELQRVYEIILGNPLYKKNFRDRIEESDSLQATDQFKTVKRSKARLYINQTNLQPHYFSRVMRGAFD